MKIIADAFGCDDPAAFVRGCALALRSDKSLQLVVAGDETRIRDVLKTETYDASRLEILHAPEVITNDDVPTVAIRAKKNSSLVVAFERSKADPEIAGMVSAGSTGAVLTGGLFKFGRIRGIDRPALAPVLPTKIAGKYTLLIDCGANVDCKPDYLAQFGMMGSIYMRAMFGIEQPRVALLSNGVEDKKGNELNHNAFLKLKEFEERKLIHFVGNMEAREILSGDYDVIVSDGFAGNIALKSMEGTANTVMSVLSEEVHKSFRAKLGALMMKKALRALKHRMDYNSVGGATLLGVEKVLVKAHGGSNAKAIAAAIGQVGRMAQFDVVKKIGDGLKDLSYDL